MADLANPYTGSVIGPASSTDNAVARYNGTTGQLSQDSGVIIDDSDNVTGIASLVIEALAYKAVPTDASPGATPTISFALDNNQEITLSETVTGVTFTAPAGPANINLIIKQPGGANYSMTGWNANIDWVGGTAPTITASNGAKDWISGFWDGTSYVLTWRGNFS